MTGLTRQRAAEAVAALFGTSARQTHESTTYDPWEVIDQDGKNGGLYMTAASRLPCGMAAAKFLQHRASIRSR